MFETRTPFGPIYRLGRYPDPWAPPDWSRAQPDGTFGNRFDDPTGYYRVLYASCQRLSCFLETLARFRPDLTLLAELREIEGEDDFFPLTQIPKAWCRARLLGVGRSRGHYADIYAAEWVGHLRSVLSAECLNLGLADLDVAVLQQGQPRRLTQLASLEIYKVGLNGIYYRSRYGHDLENWAIFEPFDVQVAADAEPISEDDPDLLAACAILGVVIER
ncbi:MAG: RES domain-containing protein [Terracidiphilus sp.]